MLDLVLNTAGNAIVACSLQSGITHYNRAAESLTGYAGDEMVGKSAHDILHAFDPAGGPIHTSDCAILAVTTDGGSRSGQATLRRKDGAFIPIEYTSSATIEDDRITGYVVVFWDITERLKMQDEVLQLQTRLAHSEKMATVGLLVASVAHEIKNPLTFIRTGLGILEQCFRKRPASVGMGPFEAPSIASPFQEALESCKEGVERIVDIVNTLRTFSRIDHQDDSSVDMGECIEATLKLMRASIPSQVRLHLQIEEVERAHCHPAQLNQVLVNLLMNALQALGEEGDIWIRVRAIGEGVGLDIEDNGPGMDPAILKRIFDPFYTTKPPDQGTGLGLSICRDIVERYGGRIDAISTPGSGTCFHLELPLKCNARSTP